MTSYLSLPGGAGDRASTPDHASLDITGALELWVDLSAAAVPPAAVQTLAGKWATTGNQRSFLFQVLTDGKLRFMWSTDGTATVTADSPSPITLPAGVRRALGVRFNPNTGTGWRVEFHIADQVDGPATLLGVTTGGAATSVFAGSAAFEVGGNGTATPFIGQMFAAQLRNGIAGTIVTEPDFTNLAGGTTVFTDLFGRPWTLNLNADIIAVPDDIPDPDPVPPIESTRDVVALEISSRYSPTGARRIEFVEERGLICTSLDLGWPEIREVSSNALGVDGSVDQTARFGPRGITVGLAAVNSDDGPRKWNDALAELGLYLHPEARPTLHLRQNWVDYRIEVVPAQSSAPFEFPNHARAQIALRAPDPYLKTPPRSATSAPFAAGTTGRTYPWTTPRTYPPSDASTGQFTVTNSGNAPVWPLVSFWGPVNNAVLRLENESVGSAFVTLPLTVEAGHRLDVDMRARTVRLDGDPDTPRFSLVDFAVSEWLHLHAGENVLRFVPGSGAAGAMVDVQWSDPYLWPGEPEP